jgi:hypothetical protein
MKKQTAVEWFFDKMKSHFEHDGDLFETVCMTYAISKAMEKEQIEIAFEQGENNSVDYFIPENRIKESEQYYNETYGGDK